MREKFSTGNQERVRESKSFVERREEHSGAEEMAQEMQCELLLRDSLQNYEALVNSIDGIVWELDLKVSRVTFVSRQIERFLGYPLRFWFSEPTFWVDHLHPEDREWVMAFTRKAIEEMRPFKFEYRMIAADGRTVWFRDSVLVIAENGVPSKLEGVTVDITDRKYASEVVRESQRNYEALVNAIDGIVWEVDAETFQFLFVSKQAERLLGYPVERWLTEPTFWQEHVHHDDVDWVVSYCKRATREMRPHEMEYRMVAADGRIVWLRDIVSVVVENNRPVKLRGVMVEVTDRKLAEEKIRKMSEELERRVVERTRELEAANKELEAFSYSVWHDLRGPLQSMASPIRALLEDYTDRLDSDAREYLESVCVTSQRMVEHIDDMLSLSRAARSEMRHESVDLSALAWSIIHELEEKDPERQVEFVIAEGVSAGGDSRLLQEVMENLLSNAWKFSGKQSQARIEFGVTQRDGKPIYFVRDNGAGFDMSHSRRLFGLFHRLHPASDFPGTGIGLATVQRIIHRHGGQVWAEGVEDPAAGGAVNRGATFYFTL